MLDNVTRFEREFADRTLGPETPSKKPAAFFSAADFDGEEIPARRWLVQDMIPFRTTTLMSGDGGTGKSQLSLQLAASTALALAWIGREVFQGTALFFTAEDERDELHRRLASIANVYGARFSDMDRLRICSVAGDTALLANEVADTLQPSPLYEAIEAEAARQRPALIVIDTLADVYPANENDRAKVRQFVQLLNRLAMRFDCAVVLLSHPSLAGMSSGSGLSGSTAWNGSVRSRLYFKRIIETGEEKEADPDARVLTTMKANYARTGDEVFLRWHDGVFINEGAVPSIGEGVKAERVFLKLLRAMERQGRTVSPNRSNTYAPTVFAGMPDAEGVKRPAFTKAMESLLSQERIEVVKEGPPSKQRTHLKTVEGVE
ncbi:AAA family ATPase [Henriciella litoralis]|uniref:AAA family ATPase n=1 Tax=Henriciella litoralis TaxID=568102 RepID=UPI0009FD0F8E|nr:AAA family ATPase [Henriciella litoralis]